MRGLLRGRLAWRGWRGFAFEDLSFVFLWTAAVLQLLLLFDPRYRDFPFASFAVPLVAVAVRAMAGDWPGRTGREDHWAAGSLALAALASVVAEGPDNLQALGWSACGLALAAPVLWRFRIPRTAGQTLPACP
jgi:hypothetical protein